MHRSQGRDLIEQLEEFFDRGLVIGVEGLIRTGKEASVYLCRGGNSAGAEWVAAKVYRARQYRFKNDAVYQQARSRELGLRGRALRAMENKSDFGREVQGGTWRYREFETLQLLYEELCDVPRPIAAAGEAILMEYIGDDETAAPPLQRVRLDPGEAGPLFQRLMNNVETFLACNRVHGDLSPHNVLYWRGEPRVIDFPQATDPRFNGDARELLGRDIANLCRYFAPYGVEADAEGLASDLWERFRRGEL